jgi:hypothetical protein
MKDALPEINQTAETLPPLLSWDDMEEGYRVHREKMDAAFEHDPDRDVLILKVEHPYEVDLEEILTSMDLLCWVRHLCEKGWMDTTYIWEFIQRVVAIKEWEIPVL